MLNNKITLDQTNSNSKEETKMQEQITNNMFEEFKQALFTIYETVDTSRMSKDKKDTITKALSIIKNKTKELVKANEILREQYVKTSTPKPETKSETKQETKPTTTKQEHYYKPNLKFIPKQLNWLMSKSAYPVLIPNQNYILLKEETPHPDDEAPDLLEYFVVYRPLSELADEQSDRLEYNKIFLSYQYNNTTPKQLLNAMFKKLLAKQSIIAEYTQYVAIIDSFKEAVFTHTISIE